MGRLKFDNPENTFVSSDFHGYHKNICKGCTSWESGADRDFNCPVAMTEQLIKNINAKVPNNGDLLFLGDWTFGHKTNIKKLRDAINCKNIWFVCGNHDKYIYEYENLFTKVYSDCYTHFFLNVQVADKDYICGHYKLATWNKAHHGVRMLWGHSHGSYPDDGKSLSFDVGVDCHNLSPLSFVDVEKLMAQREYKPLDHHKDKSQE